MDFKTLVKLLTPPQILLNYVRESAQITHKNLLITLGIILLFSSLTASIVTPLMFLILNFPLERETQNMLLSFLSIPFISYLSCGLIRCQLRITRNLPVRLKYFFLWHWRYPQMLILFTLYYICYILLFKWSFDFEEYEGIMKIRVAAGFIIFFWLLVRLCFSPLFIVDADYSARRAMKASFLLTSGRTVKTFTMLAVSFMFFFTGLGFSILSYQILGKYIFFDSFVSMMTGMVITIFLGSYLVSIVLNGLIMSYDINLKNKFSKRKKLISRASIKIKKRLEETLFYPAVEQSTNLD